MTTGDAVAVSVIVCAYTLDRWEQLVACVESIGAQTSPPHETIVVIDQNEGMLSRARASLAPRGAIVVGNAHTPGLSGARRTGADRASGAILAFVDDDAIADREWLQQLTAPYANEDVLGVGGFIEPLWETSEPRWFPPEFNWVVGCTYAGMPLVPSRIRNPIGANMSIRADVLRRSGSFDSRLGRVEGRRAVTGTAEETELGIRAAARHPGRYWLYQPSARVRHLVPAGRATVRYFVRRCWVEGHAKAVLAGLAGAHDGLRTERSYTLSVLPRAVGRGLRGAARGDLGGLLRAAAIVGGFGVTSFAYAVQRARGIGAAAARAGDEGSQGRPR